MAALYANFPDSGKRTFSATELAKLAIESASSGQAPPGLDGISYLMQVKEAGVVTPLLPEYERQILKMTSATTLAEALAMVSSSPK